MPRIIPTKEAVPARALDIFKRNIDTNRVVWLNSGNEESRAKGPQWP